MWRYVHTDEMYHYGIPGMKWGHRRSGPKYQAKVEYKQAKKEYRKARRGTIIPTLTGVGIKGIARAKQARSVKNKADMKRLNAKIKYKTVGIKDPNKAAKKEMKMYTKEMYKTGLPGSASDNGRSTRIYNTIKAKKGKTYADKIQKKVQNKAVRQLVGSGVVLLGTAVASRLASEAAFNYTLKTLQK